MKKLLITLSLLIVAMSAAADLREDILSLLFGNKNASKNVTSKVDKKKIESDFKSINQLYSQGKISSDSVINLALYHKVYSPELAELCLKLVSDKNNLRGMTELGSLYTTTSQFSKHASEGVKLLETAAKAGYNEANAHLARYYFNNQKYDKAKKYMDACHPMDQSFCYLALGNMYLVGNGVPKDNAKATENYLKGALMGNPRSMLLYGKQLLEKEGGCDNYPDAFFWNYIAGDLGENYSRTLLFLPRLEEEPGETQEDREAQFALELNELVHSEMDFSKEPLYKDGFLGGIEDRTRAADAGDDWSRYYIGSMCYNEDFMNQNYELVLRFYEPIIKNGKLPKKLLAVVYERVADMYRNGKGVKVDKAKADRYIRLAADYGSLSAYKTVENISK
ncbi:MAG: SEL1-like repeat protein [Bacteroides sp.]|nr:SEL1-like repeat protein [Bacteroides sp.]